MRKLRLRKFKPKATAGLKVRWAATLLPQTPSLTPLPGMDQGGCWWSAFPSAPLQSPSFCPCPVGAGHRNCSFRAPVPSGFGADSPAGGCAGHQDGVVGHRRLHPSFETSLLAGSTLSSLGSTRLPAGHPELCPQHLMALSSPLHICFLLDWCTRGQNRRLE